MFSSTKKITPGLILLVSIGISGCDPITLTAASLGAGIGANHALGGMIYKTFTAPVKSVETATVRAMKDMGIEIKSRENNEEGERMILATANQREIEVRLESLSKRTTQMRAVANDGMFYDSATATEIVMQTERVLAGS